MKMVVRDSLLFTCQDYQPRAINWGGGEMASEAGRLITVS